MKFKRDKLSRALLLYFALFCRLSFHAFYLKFSVKSGEKDIGLVGILPSEQMLVAPFYDHLKFLSS